MPTLMLATDQPSLTGTTAQAEKAPPAAAAELAEDDKAFAESAENKPGKAKAKND